MWPARWPLDFSWESECGQRVGHSTSPEEVMWPVRWPATSPDVMNGAERRRAVERGNSTPFARPMRAHFPSQKQQGIARAMQAPRASPVPTAGRPIEHESKRGARDARRCTRLQFPPGDAHRSRATRRRRRRFVAAARRFGPGALLSAVRARPDERGARRPRCSRPPAQSRGSRSRGPRASRRGAACSRRRSGGPSHGRSSMRRTARRERTGFRMRPRRRRSPCAAFGPASWPRAPARTQNRSRRGAPPPRRRTSPRRERSDSARTSPREEDSPERSGPGAAA